MAMMDYGAIAFKNGKLVSTDVFTPMIDMVGWEDTEEDVYHDYYNNTDKPLGLKGNYFAYIGDEECTVAFYKNYIRIIEKLNSGSFCNKFEFLTHTCYVWSKWKCWVGESYMKITKRNGYLVCKWRYKGDKYKVYFGYGVDFGYYKKYHIVNYYRSPEFIFRYAIPNWIKDKVNEIKEDCREIKCILKEYLNMKGENNDL
jgi:hypothetical protein